MATLYGQRYYAYGKPPSRGSQFAAGFVRGIADALEQRNQAIMKKREQELQKEFQREQQRLAAYQQSIRPEMAQFINPSEIVQMQAQLSAAGVPFVPVDPMLQRMQMGQQQGVEQLQRKTKAREAGLTREIKGTRLKREKTELGRIEKGLTPTPTKPTKPVAPEKPVFGDKEFDKDYQRNRKSVLVEMEKAKAGPFGIVQPGLIEPITPEEEEIIHQETMRRTVDEWNRLGKTVPKRFLPATAKGLWESEF